jgi:hypothetical protein
MASADGGGEEGGAMSVPISAEARGKLRVLKQNLARQYDAVDRTPDVMAEDIKSFAFRGSPVGRVRAFDRIATRMAQAGARLEHRQLQGKTPWALWAVLKPRGAVVVNADPATGEAQRCIVVEYFIVGSVRGRNTRVSRRDSGPSRFPTMRC